MNAGKLFSVKFLWFEVSVGQILHAIGVFPDMLGMARGDIFCLTNVDFAVITELAINTRKRLWFFAL